MSVEETTSLRQLVQPVGELTFRRGPVGPHDLVGDPTEQEGLGVLRLLEPDLFPVVESATLGPPSKSSKIQPVYLNGTSVWPGDCMTPSSSMTPSSEVFWLRAIFPICFSFLGRLRSRFSPVVPERCRVMRLAWRPVQGHGHVRNRLRTGVS